MSWAQANVPSGFRREGFGLILTEDGKFEIKRAEWRTGGGRYAPNSAPWWIAPTALTTEDEYDIGLLDNGDRMTFKTQAEAVQFLRIALNWAGGER